ncbi:hypothetical protein KJ758_02330 [Patescibacteria group bacterium]|nr:hypothetical protein [Patescibacteria group bacterium]
MEKLISIGQILDQTIDHYAKHFKNIMKFSLWFLLVSLFLIISGLLLPIADIGSLATESISTTSLVGSILMIISTLILAPVVSLWIYISIIQSTQKQRQGQTIDHKAIAKTSWKKFFPYAWVSILRTLVLLIPLSAVIPGLALILINLVADGGVWLGTLSILLTFLGSIVGIIILIMLSVQLGFVGFTMVLENKRGLASLKTSRELVKGRFWHTFVRLLVPKIAFTAAIVIFQFILFAISSPLIAFGATDTAIAAHITDVVNNVITGGITVLSVPLYIIADYLIYDSLRTTKK